MTGGGRSAIKSHRRQQNDDAPSPAMRHGTPMGDYYIYIMAGLSRRFYIGMTNGLRRRVWEHKHGAVRGFTSQYRITRLLYFEQTSEVRVAIAREKQLK